LDDGGIGSGGGGGEGFVGIGIFDFAATAADENAWTEGFIFANP
jgi:hypothetical protein